MDIKVGDNLCSIEKFIKNLRNGRNLTKLKKERLSLKGKSKLVKPLLL